MLQKIFLIGFMGSGKSYWGRIWAEELKIDFVELDDLIEQQEGMSIAAVFEQKGEQYFRKVESSILKKCLRDNSCIISTGGGAPCYFDNMQWMNGHGTSIYLKASPHELAHRLKDEREKRPLIKNIPATDLEDFITQKLATREQFYKQARFILDTAELNNNSLSILKV